jgi:hypothetical protein
MAMSISFRSVFAFALQVIHPPLRLIRQLQRAQLDALDRTRFDTILLIGIEEQDLAAAILSQLSEAFGE